jgi:hypothetical protein
VTVIVIIFTNSVIQMHFSVHNNFFFNSKNKILLKITRSLNKFG